MGLSTFYSNKLAALEDALLAAREEMFLAAEIGQDFSEVGGAEAGVSSCETSQPLSKLLVAWANRRFYVA